LTTQTQTAANTLLVFEDDAAMCALLDDLLRPRGIHVVLARLDDSPVEQVDAVNAAVVVTDLRMPNLDGNEVCRQLVKERSRVPVIVMTGFGSMESAVLALRAGAFDFVTKPIDAGHVVATVERAFAHARLSVEEQRLPLDEVERRHVLGVLQAMEGNRRRTAEVLGIDPKTLYRKLISWGVTGRGD
jgi:DNA-binding NtrC family response regulator